MRDYTHVDCIIESGLWRDIGYEGERSTNANLPSSWHKFRQWCITTIRLKRRETRRKRWIETDNYSLYYPVCTCSSHAILMLWVGSADWEEEDFLALTSCSPPSITGRPRTVTNAPHNSSNTGCMIMKWTKQQNIVLQLQTMSSGISIVPRLPSVLQWRNWI